MHLTGSSSRRLAWSDVFGASAATSRSRIAFGLALMAFFTALWTAWAFSAARGWLIILAGAFWLAAV
jgi:hypothetical protein